MRESKIKDNIFVTGMSRSGTTLIEKLLTNHKDIDIVSQPFPLVFVAIKKLFLKIYNIDKYYVLNDYINNESYSQDDFNKFLEHIEINIDSLDNVFKDMERYSGQYTKPSNIEAIYTNSSLQSFHKIYQESIRKFKTKKALFIGSKETSCEEFLPYLCSNGYKTIIIVRDPRDVASSANYPKGEKHFGSKKPLLFILKSWIKSIQIIHLLQNEPNFLYLKYEDLATSPYKTLNTITDFLGVDSFDDNHFNKGIFDRDGKLWKANTSFETNTSFISTKSIGGYKNVLSDDEINYIESVCRNEMSFMGYSFDTQPNKEIIQNFKDYGIEESKHLDKNFSSLKINIEEELRRFDKE